MAAAVGTGRALLATRLLAGSLSAKAGSRRRASLACLSVRPTGSAAPTEGWAPREVEVDAPVVLDDASDGATAALADAVLPALETRAKRVVSAAIAYARGDDGFFRHPTPPLDAAAFEVSIMLCSDERMQALNAEWRGMDKPTDVLAFPVGVPGDDADAPLEPVDAILLEEEEDEVEAEVANIMKETGDAELEVLSNSAERVEPADDQPQLPMLLGDIVIALPTAAAQASDFQHDVNKETELLLVHGVLHLLGYDHEPPPDAEPDSLEEVEFLERAAAMAAAERAVLAALGWDHVGLLDRATTKASEAAAPVRIGTNAALLPSAGARKRERLVDALFLDLDGTTLDATSRLGEANADAIEAALLEGVQVIVATGKARPAVLELFEESGLSSSDPSRAGRVTAVGPDCPGIFIQGLDVFGRGGESLTASLPGHPFLDARATSTAVGAAIAVARGGWAEWWASAANGRPMPAEVAAAVAELEERSAANTVPGVPLVGFLGDTCVSIGPEAHPEVADLHERYREPLSSLFGTPEAALSAAASEAAWKKGLIFGEPELITRVLRPLVDAALEGSSATTMQAIDTMLEVVPRGFNKAVAAQAVAAQLGIAPERCGAVGDGENDRELLLWAGRPALVANAAPTLRSALAGRGGEVLEVSSNADSGVAEAIEQLCF